MLYRNVNCLQWVAQFLKWLWSQFLLQQSIQRTSLDYVKKEGSEVDSNTIFSNYVLVVLVLSFKIIDNPLLLQLENTGYISVSIINFSFHRRTVHTFSSLVPCNPRCFIHYSNCVFPRWRLKYIEENPIWIYGLGNSKFCLFPLTHVKHFFPNL